MAKRTNRVACLLAMACLWFPALGAEQARGPFADIPMNAPAAAAVNSLAELGLVNGYPDGLYRGKKQMSRYEGMTVVYRLLQQRLMRDPALPVDVGMPILAPAMSDVPADHWAADVVEGLRKWGIIAGYPDGTFRGDQPISEGEFALVLTRLGENVVRLWERLQGQPLGDKAALMSTVLEPSHLRPRTTLTRARFAALLNSCTSR